MHSKHRKHSFQNTLSLGTSASKQEDRKSSKNSSTGAHLSCVLSPASVMVFFYIKIGG
jgi:hypothetical protein